MMPGVYRNFAQCAHGACNTLGVPLQSLGLFAIPIARKQRWVTKSVLSNRLANTKQPGELFLAALVEHEQLPR